MGFINPKIIWIFKKVPYLKDLNSDLDCTDERFNPAK